MASPLAQWQNHHSRFDAARVRLNLPRVTRMASSMSVSCGVFLSSFAEEDADSVGIAAPLEVVGLENPARGCVTVDFCALKTAAEGAAVGTSEGPSSSTKSSCGASLEDELEAVEGCSSV